PGVLRQRWSLPRRRVCRQRPDCSRPQPQRGAVREQPRHLLPVQQRARIRTLLSYKSYKSTGTLLLCVLPPMIVFVGDTVVPAHFSSLYYTLDPLSRSSRTTAIA